MRLRHHLLLLSLVTLALPWVGCQTIQEMDGALRRGQTDSLAATARAVSARLASDALLSQTLSDISHHPYTLFAHQLRSAPFSDGYADDWISQGYDFQTPASKDMASIVLGVWQNQLHVMLRLKQKDMRYFHPADTALAATDYLQLHTQQKTYAIYASAPGQLMATRLASPPEVSDKNREYQIKGYWRQREEGIQVEFNLPFAWVRDGGMALSLSSSNSAPELQPIVSPIKALSDELQVFSGDTLRLHVLTRSGYRVGGSGNLSIPPLQTRQHGLLVWLYRLALGNQAFPELNSSFATGIMEAGEIELALLGEAVSTWYKLGEQPIARASLPVKAKGGDVIGAVIAEQSANTLSSLTGDAFSKMLVYSLLASIFTAVSLIAYATWLSMRIRQLNTAAANAISDSGKIAEHFQVFNSNDELGELSRSYAHLLSRLREYTNYLRTLSSKLSHELRTPLAIVRSSLDNLEHEKLGKQAKIYSERAREGTTRLSNILNSMSAASRVEQAIGTAEREVIPFDQLLVNLKDAYEDVYQDVTFKLNIRNEDKRFNVEGSGELLVQALDKLVDNAADFCPKEGQIELGLYRHQQHVVFTVRNEGPPLPSHMHGQLFDSMVSVRDKTLPQEEGHHLGLGLYVVRLITDFHSGEVQGYNVPDNSGVIFEVRLPAYDAK